MRKLLFIAPLPLALLMACKPAEIPATEASPGAASGTEVANAEPAAAAPLSVDAVYDCTPAKAISVRYDNHNPKEAEADVTIDGRKYELDQVLSASGARYFTDDGLADKKTLTWWNKGKEGTLYEGNEGGDPLEKTLATCKEKA